MTATIRSMSTTIDETLTEGGRAVDPPARIAVVLAVIENPWSGRGFVDELGPSIEAVAPDLGKVLSDRVVTTLDAPVEAYGKAAIVGLDGEIEHGSGLIHTLQFGNHFREAAQASTLLPAVEKRAAAGTVFDIPLKHVTDATTRSHHQTVEARVPDAPRADEIIIGLAAAAQGRPQARLAPLTNES